MSLPPTGNPQGRRAGEFERADVGLGAAMSFEDIGRALGITKGGAWMLYRSAIRKLRARPLLLRELREMVADRQRGISV